MLSFDIRSLESHAAVVDEELSANDPVWQSDDPKPEGAVHVNGRLSAAGPGRFYWHGRIEGDVVLECNRCLAETRAHVSDEAHLIFAEAGGEDIDDPDVYQLGAHATELDLRPALREEWLLAAPAFGLCREECRGLCPRCGADLNNGSCDCEEQSSNPSWGELRKFGGRAQ